MTNVGLNCIETYSGDFIDLLDPSPANIHPQDISWALTRMPRYAGHTTGTLPYTVAQHSVEVTNLVLRLNLLDETELIESFMSLTGGANPSGRITNSILLHTLLHDASEAYLMDIPTPLKRLPGMKEAYGALEAKMMKAVWQRFNLAEPDAFTLQVIHWADMYALTVEAHHLMKSKGKGWSRLLKVSPTELQDFTRPKPALQVNREFRAELSAWHDAVLRDAMSAGTVGIF
jgi:hypothetical protein